MSNLTKEMASPKALRDWCRATCARYPNVEIKNLSTSFRDGLAFCAIIHKHRPDLIDFSSLSKNNPYDNNKLAFEIAERKLGIPALLDPNDMVSTQVPDCLSVITYLSWHYCVFNRRSDAGPASLGSSHVAILNNLTKSQTPSNLKHHKRLTDLKTSREARASNTRQWPVCPSCFKPVHLIQRRLIDGKVYHRSCFRCRVCSSTLLPGSYTQGSDAGSLICIHHTTEPKSTDSSLSRQDAPAENQPKCSSQTVFSLSGIAISSVPLYSKRTESLDGPVCVTADMEAGERQGASTEGQDGESRDHAAGVKRKVKKPAPPPPPPSPHPHPEVTDRVVEETGKAGPATVPADDKVQQEATEPQQPSALVSPCVHPTEGGRQPAPVPRRKLSSFTAPVPAPRTKTAQTANNSSAAGSSSDQHARSPRSCHISSPTTGSPKYQSNHPWLTIVEPGPWRHLPPAKAPTPAPRSWYRPKVPPPNPFAKDANEDTKAKSSAAADGSENGGDLGGVTKIAGASGEPAGDTGQMGSSHVDETGEAEGSGAGGTEAAVAAAAAAVAAGAVVASSESQSQDLPRSLSVPTLSSAQCSPQPADTAGDQVMPCQSKPVCKENPFDRKAALSKSKTFQSLPSRRPPAPGHGFPLIKRKVQTDYNVSIDNLQVEMKELNERLEAMEKRGVELERSLRDSIENDEEEEQMLMEWFSLNHERHLLVRRDAELGHLALQQKLEERQADVEYELRCLLNKQECDWTQDDRGKEQRLMDELVAIIDQRNQIISSLDQDLQRERGEDKILEATMRNKEFQKEGLKELRRSKGKFSSSKVFKLLNHKGKSE